MSPESSQPPDEFQTQPVAALSGHVAHDSQDLSARATGQRRPGSRIDDFEIIQMLGKGAFAEVYLARQLSMARLVALKISGGDGDEPQALAQFDHPNIVRVYDQRIVDRSHLLYMQYHPGGTLADVVTLVREVTHDVSSEIQGEVYLRAIDANLLAAAQVVPERSGTRDWLATADWPKVVAWVGIQLSQALQAAHQAGVLHRDVKPANVLLTAEGIPQLADFNVSLTDAPAAFAQSGQSTETCLGGSLGYMSPEHLRAMHPKLSGSPGGIREPADLYSLAVLLWELWQGQRPFECNDEARSPSDMIHEQIASRSRPLKPPNWAADGTGKANASARVLHRVLVDALSVDPSARPVSGGAMAGRLKLAMHPEAARLFEPEAGSLADRLMRISPWWVATVAILLPNIAAGWFNYQYNQNEIMTEQMRAGLDQIAFWVNAIAFPFAVGLMIYFTSACARALGAACNGETVGPQELRATLELGHRAAIIGGTCWTIAGIVYPILLRWRFSEFTSDQATHFFLSLLMCGGVAMIYPLFVLGMITTHVYYPQMIRPTMIDSQFHANAKRIKETSESYLLIAVLIPLFGLALMVFGESQSKGFMLTAIFAGMLGLFGSFKAYRSMVQTWERLGEVLASK
ncbi:serine/threonine-protein kinase [Neorhodopirellula pilleata]|uniref:Serine/threonine-protein kinase PrkC n=1 Tax=Neorhodopirellula pilleata TaxID=2714738 RepID=A0A5C6A1H9_9BACT|nr:serine/threonine-protein kinase [Neorhodopirellula pilleata]TWT93692.1 Serine/threonine-protein kinase PrkC [Neorhodopirellula pilleata]